MQIMEKQKQNQKRPSKKVLLQAIAEKGVDKKIVDSLARSNIDALPFVNDLIVLFFEPRDRFIPQCRDPWRAYR